MSTNVEISGPSHLTTPLVYGSLLFQAWSWRGQVMLRGQQIAEAVDLPPAHVNQWHARYARRFKQLPGMSTAVVKLPDLHPPVVGRWRSREVRLFSLLGASMLCELIGTPAAHQFATWLAERQADELV